jgi:hypothetical protein
MADLEWEPRRFLLTNLERFDHSTFIAKSIDLLRLFWISTVTFSKQIVRHACSRSDWRFRQGLHLVSVWRVLQPRSAADKLVTILATLREGRSPP